MADRIGASTNIKDREEPGAVDDHEHEPGRLYFGYGSNLSSTQMCARCPDSQAVGLAYLPGYAFIINERGYANVVPVKEKEEEKTMAFPSADEADMAPNSRDRQRTEGTTSSRHRNEPGVYGIVYELGDGDEEFLDVYEGVSMGSYAKELHTVELLVPSGEWQAKPALVYIDGLRVSEATPRKEYVARMNRGVDEAKREWGLPQDYIDDVVRRFIPAAPAF